jgi:hypothetical protein
MGKSANLTRVVDGDGGIGYQPGRGGAVTQLTSKSTAVTLNQPSGRITLNNTRIKAGDSLHLTLSGTMGTMVNYNIWGYVTDNSAIIAIKNISAGALTDAPTINFAVIKVASA